MSALRGSLGLAAICLVIILVSVAGLFSDFATHLEFNIDGLLLILICVLMGGLFFLMLLLVAKEQGWLPHFPSKKTVDGAAPPKPAAPAPGSGEGK